jgi:hypothetical protein
MRFVIIISILFFNIVFAHSLEYKQIYYGIITDSSSSEKIEFVHVINLSKNLATYSDNTGYFRIPFDVTDTILFTAIGYHNKKIIAFKSEKTSIKLIPKKYQIEEVSVGILGSYDQFKQKFLNLEIEDNTINIRGLPKVKKKEVPDLENEDYISNPLFLLGNPISYFYYNFNKYEQSKRKVHELNKLDIEKRIIEKKFNREIVKTLTKLTDEMEINEFLDFCNFSHNYLLKTSEYDIQEALIKKFKEFQGRKGVD